MYRIYLADDETWVVIGLKKQIEKSGLPFQVIGEANNGVAAMEEILEKKPDVLISDIRMPGLNGLQLLEKLREKGLDVKVIFISGYAEFEYAQSAIRMGTFDYLLKPVEQEKLDQVLERLLGAFRSGRGGGGGSICGGTHKLFHDGQDHPGDTGEIHRKYHPLRPGGGLRDQHRLSEQPVKGRAGTLLLRVYYLKTNPESKGAACG